MARTVTVNGTTAAEATSGFALLPAGDYIAKIVDVQDAVTQGKSNPVNKGLDILKVRVKIIETSNADDEGLGRQFTDFQVPLFPKWNSGGTAFTFYTFFKALGVVFPEKGSDEEVELPENEDILGEEIGIKLSVEPKDSRKPVGDDNPLVNNIKNYFAASDGLKAVATKSDGFTL